MGLRTWLGLKIHPGKARAIRRDRKAEAPIGTEFDRATLPAMLGCPDPTILEIGANDGSNSDTFLKLFPQAKLYCFEPDSRAIADWKSQMGGTSARLIESAIGRREGTAQFHVSSGRQSPGDLKEWHKSGSIHEPTGHIERHPWVHFSETAPVPITTLDGWTQKNAIEKIDFIWADVQGAEGDLIEGGLKTLARTRYFYTEYSNQELYSSQWSLKQIEERLSNFKLLARYPNDALFVNCALSGARLTG